MSTLKLKKPARPGGPGKPSRPPVRGAGSPPRPRQTLAQAQQERAEREERMRRETQERGGSPWGDRPPRPRDEAPRGAFGSQRPRQDERRGAFGTNREQPRQDNYPRGRDEDRSSQTRPPRDNYPGGRVDERRSAFGQERQPYARDNFPRGRGDEGRGAPGRPARDDHPRHRGEGAHGAFGQGRPRQDDGPGRRDDQRRGAFGHDDRQRPTRDDFQRPAEGRGAFGGPRPQRDERCSAFGDPRSGPGGPGLGRHNEDRGAYGGQPRGDDRREGARPGRPFDRDADRRPDRQGHGLRGDRPPAPEYVPRGDKPVGGRDRRPDLRQPRRDAPAFDPRSAHDPAGRRDDAATGATPAASTNTGADAHAPAGVRLSKRMSELGLASRREADEWIERGWVKVDGVVVNTLGSRVRPEQTVEIDSRAAGQQAERVTVLLNKPAGYVSGQAEDGNLPANVLCTPDNRSPSDRSGITYQRDHVKGIAPAGRLDMESTGLLVYTQDGRVAKQLIAGDGQIEKEYVVKVASESGVGKDSGLSDDSLALLRHGLELDGVALREAEVEWLDDENLRFVLREGKKRQIRRMCEAVGLQVLELQRVRIGKISLGDLEEGQWRYLSPNESFA